MKGSLQHYEAKITEQTTQLSKLNKPRDYGSDCQSDGDGDTPAAPVLEEFTEEDMRVAEEEIRELEHKKRSLEERVTNMEKDISGVTR